MRQASTGNTGDLPGGGLEAGDTGDGGRTGRGQSQGQAARTGLRGDLPGALLRATLRQLPEFAEDAGHWTETLQGLRVSQLDLDAGRLVVASQAPKALQAVRKKLSEPLQHALNCAAEDMGLSALKLEFAPSPARPAPGRDAAPSPGFQPRELPGSGGLNRELNFGNLVVGASNRVAVQAVQAFANGGSAAHQASFLPEQLISVYGPNGMGKTHLLNAAGLAYGEWNPAGKVLLTKGQDMLDGLMKCFRESAEYDLERWRNAHRSADLLLVDGADVLVGKRRTEEEFCNILSHLLENRSDARILISFGQRPVDLDMSRALLSRLQPFQQLEMRPPDAGMVRAMVQRFDFPTEGGKLPEEALGHLSDLMKGHPFAPLLGVVRRLFADLASGYLKASDLDRRRLATIVEDRCGETAAALSPENIMQAVASYYKMPIENLRRRNRVRQVLEPRQMAMYLVREQAGLSFPQIARTFGFSCHTTAMNAHKRCAKRLEDDAGVRRDHDRILRGLRNP